MAITPSDFSKIWASNADTPEYTFSEANYLKGWDFVGNLPPTRAMWNAMQKSTDEKMKYVFDNFGAPLIASTVAEMTLTNRVYVYTGSETGYTAGRWYYWDGSAWTDGGVYNSTAFNTDTTLTISGAAADAKVVGDNIRDLEADIIDNNSFDRFKHLDRVDRTIQGVTFQWNTDGSCTVTGTATGAAFTNMFVSQSSFPKGFKKGNTYVILYNANAVILELYKYVNGTLSAFNQSYTSRFVRIPDDADGLLIRLYVTKGTTVNETVNPICLNVESNELLYRKALINFGASGNLMLGSSDADTMKENSIVFVSNSAGGSTVANTPYSPGILVTLGGGNYFTTSSFSKVQFMYPWRRTDSIMFRTKQGDNSWGAWASTDNDNVLLLSNNTDLNDLTDKSGKYLLSSGMSFPNNPFDPAACFLEVYKVFGYDTIIQIAYGWGTNTKVYKRTKITNADWLPWTLIGGGGGDVYNTTQNVTQVSNKNTYNINVEPQITTDSNGWLQPIDSNTADETNKTDMTSAIMGMLNSTGYCHLAAGIYYVSGNIDMPEGSTLEGCGNNTIIRLLSNVTSGYCVRMGRFNTIKNIRFSGGYNTLDVSRDSIGGRNGVIFIANKDGSEVAQPTVRPCILTGCWFENFNGSGIYAHNSGGGTSETMTISDSFIQYCIAGINLDYYTEYHKVTNVITYHCHYACINNGGNNVFTGCTFHGTIGFLMDNSSDTKRNTAHGSCIGCTFNHIDNWNHPDVLGMGDAIKFIGSSTPGFIFSGCQIWYGSIVVNNAKGICFNSCLIGGNTPQITIENNATAFFDGCMFAQTPNITNTAFAKFDNCYLISNGSIVTGL